MKEFIIKGKRISIFYKNLNVKTLPVIILNIHGDEGNRVWEMCQKQRINDFILVTISNIDWNNDLTPWECPALYKGDSACLGYADKYLDELENDFIPPVIKYIKSLKIEIDYFGIAGYSLGGLFALYAGYKSDLFQRIVSASGSLWYPDFENYVKNHHLNKNVKKVYFSLGNKEAKTKISLLSTVEEKTINIYKWLGKSIDTIYEENDGNHFQNVELRIAKGIEWILD